MAHCMKMGHHYERPLEPIDSPEAADDLFTSGGFVNEKNKLKSYRTRSHAKDFLFNTELRHTATAFEQKIISSHNISRSVHKRSASHLLIQEQNPVLIGSTDIGKRVTFQIDNVDDF